MAKKVFTYYGKTVEELQALDIKEFAKLAPSRAKRSLMRGNYNKNLIMKVDRANEQKKAGKNPVPIRTHLRQAIILPKMIGLQFAIYTGKSFELTTIEPEMIGHYLGEYQNTRKHVQHGRAGIGATKSSTAITAK